jgi:4-amino-4-deoxy-L-arabinose transferase-like glycosyltransferase
MSTQQAAVAQRVARSRALPWIFLSYLAVTVVAILPRVLDLGGFVTEDEASFWLLRSETFFNALRSGDWAATAITDHPGVTTTWLGSAGILLRRVLVDWGIVQEMTYSTRLAVMRLPGALLHAGAILLGYALMRRMLPAVVALLAAVFWAADPFVIAYSRLLHVDALLGSFATLSVLAACYYWHHGQHPAALALSGVCGALAMLSKSPGLILFPFAGLVAVGAAWERRDLSGTLRRVAPSFVGWCAICCATIYLLWPALWASPIAAYVKIREGVVAEGIQPHQQGNFFLGRQDAVPGPHFYPLALLLRLTPITLLGLLFVPWALRRAEPRARRDLLRLGAFVLVFLVAMSIFPKKFNRYLEPAFPSVDILCAAGLVWAAERLSALRPWSRRLAERGRAANQRVAHTIVSGLALLAVLNAAYWHPYSIAAFNQALGGAYSGSRAFQVGWGEGFEQVAAWLNAQPDITGVLVVSSLFRTLEPYLGPGTQAMPADRYVDTPLPDEAGYIVVYVRDVQDGRANPPFTPFYGRQVPLNTVRIHGVDYAWIYQVPPQVANARAAVFGEMLHLRGYTLGSQPRRGQPLVFKLSWAVPVSPPQDYMLFAHLLGPDGQPVAQADIPYPTSQWQPGRYPLTELPLQLPADAPAGRYRLMVGFYDAATGERLALAPEVAADPAIDGPNALLLAEFPIE